MTRVTSTAGIAPHCGRDPGPLRGHDSEGGRRSAVSIIGPGGNRAAGLALRAAPPAEDGADVFEIAVIDADSRTLIALGPFGGEDVVATWRGMAASSGLELVIGLRDGAVARPYPQLGRIQLGSVRVRRRHGLFAGRRPRFLARRKTGRLPVRPDVHRGEREIAAGAKA